MRRAVSLLLPLLAHAVASAALAASRDHIARSLATARSLAGLEIGPNAVSAAERNAGRKALAAHDRASRHPTRRSFHTWRKRLKLQAYVERYTREGELLEGDGPKTRHEENRYGADLKFLF